MTITEFVYLFIAALLLIVASIQLVKVLITRFRAPRVFGIGDIILLEDGNAFIISEMDVKNSTLILTGPIPPGSHRFVRTGPPPVPEPDDEEWDFEGPWEEQAVTVTDPQVLRDYMEAGSEPWDDDEEELDD